MTTISNAERAAARAARVDKAQSYAFPHISAEGHPDHAGGLTKREWFAGLAMQALVSEMADAMARGDDNIVLALSNTSRLSYAIADAMIEARRK